MDRFGIFLKIVWLDEFRFGAVCIPLSWKQHLWGVVCWQGPCSLVGNMGGFGLFGKRSLLPFAFFGLGWIIGRFVYLG